MRTLSPLSRSFMYHPSGISYETLYNVSLFPRGLQVSISLVIRALKVPGERGELRFFYIYATVSAYVHILLFSL